jgi:hypothetical protein
LTLVVETLSVSEGSNDITVTLGFKDIPDATLDTVEVIAEATDRALSDSLSATPSLSRLGDLITVVVTARNISDQTINDVQIEGEMTVTEINQDNETNETGSVSLPGTVVGPTSVSQLAPMESASFTVQFTATNFGTVTFNAAVTGTNAEGDEASSEIGESDLVDILPKGDLLIKASYDSSYAGAGIYQTNPAPPQIVTNEVGTNAVASFDIQIVNNEDEPLDFTLSATERSTNWITHYLLQGQDITENLQTNMDLPTLEPGASLTLAVETTSTNTGFNPIQITLGLASVPDLVADAVEAVAVSAAGSDLPALSIASTGKSFTLSWALWAGTYALQVTTNLSANNWEPIVTSPTTNGQIVSLIIPLTPTSSFFRLQKQ